jgi:hypothetical protein
MRISLKELRKMIREQVERNMRWTAGMTSGFGLSQTHTGINVDPIVLGDEIKDEDESENDEKI